MHKNVLDFFLEKYGISIAALSKEEEMSTNNAWSRGRGRGYSGGKEKNPSKEPWKVSSGSSKDVPCSKPENRMINMAAKYANILDNYESSSDEDELHDEKILEKTVGSYNDALGGNLIYT